MIEVRHCEQPLRAFIIDDKFARFKESRYVFKQSGKTGNIKQKTFVFYEIKDEEWIEWIHKIFFNLFRTSIKADKRIIDIESIEKIN
jgi:hypothetical protein